MLHSANKTDSHIPQALLDEKAQELMKQREQEAAIKVRAACADGYPH
jgi:hypothetical protein